MKSIMIGAMLLTACFSLQAANLESFDKRFKTVRDSNGELKAIKMKTFSQGFSLKPFIEKIKTDLKEEIARLQNPGFHSDIDELIAFLDDNADKSMDSDELVENLRYTRESLERLPLVNVDESFKKIDLSNVLQNFEKELKEALFKFDLAVVASPMDAKYFYRRNVTYEVVTRALNFAKKKFDSVPLLNLASFMIVKVHDLVLEQRLYHQYMLMHYLENAGAKEIGLTDKEIDRVYSSVFEARIQAINFQESKRAAANWDKYGADKFFTMLRTANTKLRRVGPVFDSVDARLNFAFVEVKEEGKKKIKNLLVNHHSFSTKMSTAYIFEEPNKIKRTRQLINLGQVGLGFLPIPGWIKGQVDSFLTSFYKEQARTEGALMGHFEMTGNTEMSKAIFSQTNNPYLIY